MKHQYFDVLAASAITGVKNFDRLHGLGVVAVAVFVTAGDCIRIAGMRLLTCLADRDNILWH
jgi:hypothetical protein